VMVLEISGTMPTAYPLVTFVMVVIKVKLIRIVKTVTSIGSMEND